MIGNESGPKVNREALARVIETIEKANGFKIDPSVVEEAIQQAETGVLHQSPPRQAIGAPEGFGMQIARANAYKTLEPNVSQPGPMPLQADSDYPFAYPPAPTTSFDFLADTPITEAGRTLGNQQIEPETGDIATTVKPDGTVGTFVPGSEKPKEE